MDTRQNFQQIFETTAWEKGSFRNYYFACAYAGHKLNGCFECEFGQTGDYDLEQLTRIKAELTELDGRAHAHIQKKFPEDDATELELNDLILLPNGVCKLGYYTGRTPMGDTYLYVGFNADFTMNDEITVEGY